MDRETLQDGVTDRSFDGAQDNGPADDQTPPEEMDLGVVSPRQRLALEAFCKGGTIGDAAKAANVSRQTLHRWRVKYPHFAVAMSSWSSACLSIAEGQLEELASRAVGALSNAIDKGDANTARAVLRSLGVLRTYQPSKAPAAARESRHAGIALAQESGAPASQYRAVAEKVTDAPREQVNTGSGEQGAAREPRHAGIALPLDSRAGEQEIETGANLSTSAPPLATAREEANPAAGNSGRTRAAQDQVSGRSGEQEIEAAAKLSASLPLLAAAEEVRPAGVSRHQDVTSEAAKEKKPAIFAGKGGSAIKRACDGALQDVTESYQMLPNAAARNSSPPGVLFHRSA